MPPTLETLDPNPSLSTQSGQRFHPLDPSPSEIDEGDLACGLASRARWSGQTSRPWSVAEHSMEVSRRLEDAGGFGLATAWGLLHDAAEAWLPDWPAPIRSHLFVRIPRGVDSLALVPYDDVETGILEAVAAHFGLAFDIPAEVWEVDLRVRATERRDLMPDLPADVWPPETAEPYPEPLDVCSDPWNVPIDFQRRLAEVLG